MADQPITSGAVDLGASGANMLLRMISNAFVRSGRNRGGPTRFITNVSDQLASKGQSVGVPVAPAVTSRTLTDGAAKVLDNNLPSTVNVTLTTQRYYAFSLTTIASALEGGLSGRILLDSAVNGVLNGVEEDIFSAATSSFVTNTAVGTYNNALTEANIAIAIQTLYDQRVPQGPLTGLVRSGTNAWGALNQIANFAQSTGGDSVRSYAEDAYGNGRLFHGARWFMTQAMPKSGTSIDNLILHPSAMAMAMRLPDTPLTGAIAQNVVDPESGLALQVIIQWDGSRWANEVAVRLLYGSAVVADKYGIQVKS